MKAPPVAMDFDFVEETVRFREELCAKDRPCPACSSRQVQLKLWIMCPIAKWKCRECKCEWFDNYEATPVRA